MFKIVNKVKEFLNKFETFKFISSIFIPWNILKIDINELNRTKEILCAKTKKFDEKESLKLFVGLRLKYTVINIQKNNPHKMPS